MTAADPVVTIDDVRKAGLCVRGARRWFELHDLDFNGFVKEGLPASVLLATRDAMAETVVARKQERDHG